MTSKERQLWKEWINTPGAALPLYAAFRKVEKRNERQRAYRASAEQKSKDALASRKSYWKNVAADTEHGGYTRDCRACKANDRAVTG